MTQPELRPAIVQDAESGRVLMLAWMDAEAERRTRESGDDLVVLRNLGTGAFMSRIELRGGRVSGRGFAFTKHAGPAPIVQWPANRSASTALSVCPV